MRPAWSLSWRSSRHRLCWSLMTGVLAFSSLGCRQCCYCYPDPACGPMPAVPSAVRAEPMCDVSSSSVDGGTVVASGPTRQTTVSGAAATTPPRVVVSQPSTPPSRFGWRTADPDSSVATTSVQGAVNDSTTKQ
jgi:hypothetical protein